MTTPTALIDAPLTATPTGTRPSTVEDPLAFAALLAELAGTQDEAVQSPADGAAAGAALAALVVPLAATAVPATEQPVTATALATEPAAAPATAPAAALTAVPGAVAGSSAVDATVRGAQNAGSGTDVKPTAPAGKALLGSDSARGAGAPATPATPAVPAAGASATPTVPGVLAGAATATRPGHARPPVAEEGTSAPDAGATRTVPATPASPAAERALSTPSRTPAQAPEASAPAPAPTADGTSATTLVEEAATEAPVGAEAPAPTATADVAGVRVETSAPEPAERSEATVRAVRPAIAELARGLQSSGPGHASLVVRLDPPELGSVLVRVQVRDGGVSISCSTGDAGAVQALQLQQDDLVELLRGEGLDLESYAVREHGLGSSRDDSREPSSPQGGRGRRHEAGERPDGAGTDPRPQAGDTDDTATWL